ncbi:hypothetical protein C7974DRAFT_47596 [Boeremia exigua]|uniref:uncharacterized protein n=1 Tax=Boeremia exigua TaxID=749465 RepID=UPI001E8DE039|nr:uncharacterized protein C7974DRAFT_47596 [Boeremia exigua]KAH6616568.1 hypothetical protein C7974DRAFT_47596 [Boeremia exigua]
MPTQVHRKLTVNSSCSKSTQAQFKFTSSSPHAYPSSSSLKLTQDTSTSNSNHDALNAPPSPYRSPHRSLQFFITQTPDDTSMPHTVSHSAFARTSLTICDTFVMALGYVSARGVPGPEELIAGVGPWYLDAETVWWRRFWMDS